MVPVWGEYLCAAQRSAWLVCVPAHPFCFILKTARNQTTTEVASADWSAPLPGSYKGISAYHLWPAALPLDRNPPSSKTIYLAMSDVYSNIPAAANRVWMFALTGAPTAIKKADTSALKLEVFSIATQDYTIPVGYALQRAAPAERLPLKQCYVDSACIGAASVLPGPLVQSTLDNGLAQLGNAVFAGKLIWTAAAVNVLEGGVSYTGVAWFAIDPKKKVLKKQGLIKAPNRNSLLYPAIALNSAGKTGAIVFTLTGPDFYPAAAYTAISLGEPRDYVNVATLGAGPQDGFTGACVPPLAGLKSAWPDELDQPRQSSPSLLLNLSLADMQAM